MPLQKLAFKPGVNRENTRLTNEGRWWNMSAVRFRSGTPEKTGGWVKLTLNAVLGVPRFLHNWITLGSENLLAVASNVKIYIERGGGFNDITPIRYTTAATNNAFTTGTAGSAVVTVNMVAHGADIGDYVTFSGAATVDGILAATLNAEFAVLAKVDADHFTITATACTAGGVTGGGAATVGAFQVSVGPPISVIGAGYGVGGYGVFGYGSAVSGSTVVTSGMRQWVGDNFGQDFIFAIRDGGLYYWQPTFGGAITTALATRGVLLSTTAGASNVPTIADNVLVTDDEHVVVFGTNALGGTAEDPMLVRWCDQGNYANWTPAITNTAGDQRLTNGSYTYAVEKMRQENLIWTDTALVSMQFVGPPVVFSFTTLATNISVASVNAVGVATNVAYWMGKGKFYVYDGQVKTLPCDVRKYVFDDFNTEQYGQVYAGTITQFNEVQWFYCSAASTYPDRYVTYNYLEGLWTFGVLGRTTWLDSPYRDYPMATDSAGYLYWQENGFDDGSTSPVSAVHSYLESADFDIGDGEKFSFVSKIIPDVDFDGSTAVTPAVTVTLEARNTPGEGFRSADIKPISVSGTATAFTPWVSTRLRGRQISFKIESTGVGVTWQLGTPRLELREDGGR